MLGRATRTLFTVQAQPPAGREEEFQTWYDTVHGPDALANGSFSALRRYGAIGSGPVTAPFLALWEGDYPDEGTAWGYIRSRAHALNNAGRVGDIASPRFALMTFRIFAGNEGAGAGTRFLTTVQSDWRHTDDAAPPERWWHQTGLDRAPAHGARLFYSSDPAGRGPGYHLALFEQAERPDPAAWRAFGAPGSSPCPPYRTIFAAQDAPLPEMTDGPPPALAWVMHWELISVLPRE